MSITTTLTLIALLPLLVAFTWLYLPSLFTPPASLPSTLKNKRIILLTAHPDDESMFFAPALQSLTAPALGNHVKLLCLSTGNATGIGETRKNELYTAALTLGMRKKEDVFILDDPRFQDGMQNDWKPEDVARVLSQAFAPTPAPAQPPTTKANKRKSLPQPAETKTEGPRATIDVLLTFDSHGISGHPNHKSLHSGAVLFSQNIMAGHLGWRCPVTLYTLTSVNIIRKYTSILDALTTLFVGVWSVILTGPQPGRSKEEKEGEKVIFVNSIGEWNKAKEAMVQGHKSQMVWFRYGWVGVGRYLVVNDLRREIVPGT